MATIDEIRTNANLVKNATEVGENSAPRVGGVLVDLTDKVGEAIDGLIKMVSISEEDYSKLVAAGKVDADTYYNIFEE